MNLSKHLGKAIYCILALLMTTPATAQVQKDARVLPPGGPVSTRPIGPIQPLVKRPDTLNLGEFMLIVDAYDSSGSWNAATRTFEGLAGTGRILFGCQHLIILGPRRIPPLRQGNLFRFSDVTAVVAKANAALGVVKTGAATYQGSPFTLDVSPGFALSVSAVTILPGKDAQATAILSLPTSLSGSCQAARLDLGVISLSNNCEFYKVVADSSYGAFGVGNTLLNISGKGYVADFSSTTGYAGVSEPNSWKGVVLLSGQSSGTPGDSVVSNTGYLQGDYTFTNGLVEQTGLSAVFSLQTPFSYTTLQPLGYTIAFDTAKIAVASSAIKLGEIRGAVVTLPRRAAVELNDSAIRLTNGLLVVLPNMNVVGRALPGVGSTLCWGDLTGAGGSIQKSFGVARFDSAALLFFSATPKAFQLPLIPSTVSIFDSVDAMNLATLDSLGMQGATFTGFGTMMVNSPQAPTTFDPDHPLPGLLHSHLVFALGYQPSRWLNVGAEGVHCNIHCAIVKADTVFIGNPSESLYAGGTPFTILPASGGGNDVAVLRTNYDYILLQCIESAVVLSNYKAVLQEKAPTKGLFQLTGMVFTSTANVAGGLIDIGLNDSLSYWGLKLVPKQGFASAGVVSVRTGQIILTASGLSETRHFAQPFWLTWGEILANGSVGQLFFDYNSANQQFDQFNFIPSAVALSPYTTNTQVMPYLHVGGQIHFPFFGGDFMNLEDGYKPTATSVPYDKRYVKLGLTTSQGIPACNRNIAGNWRDGLGIFKFLLSYDSLNQNGFLGLGTSNVRYLSDTAAPPEVGTTIRLNNQGSCMRIGTNVTDIRSIALGPVANVSEITQIWGCACIMNDDISNLVVGGSLTTAANASVLIRAGAYLSSILQVTPSMVRYTLDGEASISLIASLDAEINGHMQLTLNEAAGYVEGEINGEITVSAGDILQGGSIDAQGQLDWHMGTDYNSIQGDISLSIMGETTFIAGTGVNLGAGFYAGIGAPKSDAWVLTDANPQYSLNTAALPDNLTGVYGYLHIQEGISLYVVSGQYDLYLGFGAFVLSTPQQAGSLGGIGTTLGLPYIVGNLGGSINGEILGGLVSAGASYDLQIIGPYPFSFQGSVGLQACVLWVICASVDLTIGLNTAQGFYIE